jgi:hypothetical protein
MRRSSVRPRIRLAIFMSLFALLLPAALGGCTTEGTCEDICFDQYDDCLARSPPGASKADCGAAYDSCMQYCSQTGDAPEEGP